MPIGIKHPGFRHVPRGPVASLEGKVRHSVSPADELHLGHYIELPERTFDHITVTVHEHCGTVLISDGIAFGLIAEQLDLADLWVLHIFTDCTHSGISTGAIPSCWRAPIILKFHQSVSSRSSSSMRSSIMM